MGQKRLGHPQILGGLLLSNAALFAQKGDDAVELHIHVAPGFRRILRNKKLCAYVRPKI